MSLLIAYYRANSKAKILKKGNQLMTIRDKILDTLPMKMITILKMLNYRIKTLKVVKTVFSKGSGPFKLRLIMFLSILSTKSWFYGSIYRFYGGDKMNGIYNYGKFKLQILPTPSLNRYLKEKSFCMNFFTLIYPFIYSPSVFHHGMLMEDNYFDARTINIEKNDIVLDCGANIGAFSIGASQDAKDGRVYAFEPFVENADYIQKNKRMNNIDNIEIVQKAVSDISGNVDFKFDVNSPASSGINNDSVDSVLKNISCISLDEFVHDNSIDCVNFIKMDIEGGERLALAGAFNIMKKFKPKLSICTYHLHDDLEVLPALILKANPSYKIKMLRGKLYAY
jgi:FkbM family methyltransferase